MSGTGPVPATEAQNTDGASDRLNVGIITDQVDSVVLVAPLSPSRSIDQDTGSVRPGPRGLDRRSTTEAHPVVSSPGAATTETGNRDVPVHRLDNGISSDRNASMKSRRTGTAAARSGNRDSPRIGIRGMGKYRRPILEADPVYLGGPVDHASAMGHQIHISLPESLHGGAIHLDPGKVGADKRPQGIGVQGEVALVHRNRRSQSQFDRTIGIDGDSTRSRGSNRRSRIQKKVPIGVEGEIIGRAPGDIHSRIDRNVTNPTGPRRRLHDQAAGRGEKVDDVLIRERVCASRRVSRTASDGTSRSIDHGNVIGIQEERSGITSHRPQLHGVRQAGDDHFILPGQLHEPTIPSIRAADHTGAPEEFQPILGKHDNLAPISSIQGTRTDPCSLGHTHGLRVVVGRIFAALPSSDEDASPVSFAIGNHQRGRQQIDLLPEDDDRAAISNLAARIHSASDLHRTFRTGIDGDVASGPIRLARLERSGRTDLAALGTEKDLATPLRDSGRRHSALVLDRQAVDISAVGLQLGNRTLDHSGFRVGGRTIARAHEDPLISIRLHQDIRSRRQGSGPVRCRNAPGVLHRVGDEQHIAVEGTDRPQVDDGGLGDAAEVQIAPRQKLRIGDVQGRSDEPGHVHRSSRPDHDAVRIQEENLSVGLEDTINLRGR